MRPIDYSIAAALAGISGLFLITITAETGTLPPLPLEILILCILAIIVAACAGLWIAHYFEKSFPILRRLSRFVITGFFNTSVDVVVFSTLAFATGMYTGISVVVFTSIAFIASLTTSYFINRHWSFESRIQPRFTEFGLFSAIIISGFIFNATIMYTLTTHITPLPGVSEALWAILARITCAFFSLLWNFTGLHFFVFTKAANATPPRA